MISVSSRILPWSCGAAVALFAAALPPAAFAQDVTARSNALLAGLERAGTPGCAVGAYRGTVPLFEGAYGLADLATGARLTPQTAFGVASVSKQFMAASVALAAEQGHLALSDDIRKYVPEMPDYGTPITVADLIYHRSGIRDDWTLIRLSGKNLETRAQIIALLARQKALVFPPGTRFLYSNSGYVLLAEVLERATHRAYPEFAQAAIFTPLGMTHSYIRDRPITNAALATPYVRGKAGWEKRDNPLNAARIGTNGVVTTIRDYAIWADNLMRADSRLQGGAALTQLLQRPGLLTDRSAEPYAFGLRTEPYKGQRTISHGGSGWGFKAHTMLFPDRGISVAGFCNNGGYAQALVMGIADIVLDLPEDRPASPEDHVATAALRQFEGVYREPSLRIPMIVKADENALLIRGDSTELRFHPVAPNRFRADGNIEIAFAPDGHGGMRLRQISERHYGTGSFARITPAAPTMADLQSYVGLYRSDELGSRYCIGIENGALTIAQVDPDADLAFRRPMMPMAKDEFVGLPDIAIRFERDRKRQVRGFTLNAQYGWVTNIRFVRLSP